MVDLSDKCIFERMQEAKKIRFESQFSLQDLVGKTISEYRQVKNPKEYNLETESPNPKNFDVLIFSDKTYLVTENWGDGGCGHLNCYYFNGKKTLYSDQLFGLL